MAWNIYTYQEENRGVEITDDKPAAALYISQISVPLTSVPTTTVFIKGMAGGAASAAAGAITVAPIVTIQSFATLSTLLNLQRSTTGNFSVAMAYFGPQSAASAPWIEFVGSGGPVVSITSVVLTTVANTNAAIRVKYGSTYGWIPIFADAAMIGTGAF